MARLFWFAALLAPCACVAQVTGSFALDKPVFAFGEPVFLNFTFTNQSAQTIEVVDSDPYSFCAQYKVEITRKGQGHTACSQGWGGSCLSGAVSLAPHASRTERILLNYQNTSQGDLNPPVSRPGVYTVDAVRTIDYTPRTPGAHLFTRPDHAEVHHSFDLYVDGSQEVNPAAYSPFVQQLASPDFATRRDAARTLATLAPATLEPLLLTFATSQDTWIKQFAPMALAHLATPASLSALAGMLRDEPAGSYEWSTAAEYLGQTHDPKWFPTLLAAADKNGSMYLGYAAESGGEAAIPALLARLASANSDTRSGAIDALGHTGSKAAIPVLIGLLKPAMSDSPSDANNAAISANVALQQLTHFYFAPGSAEFPVAEARQHWELWWRSTGGDAKTYRPGECVTDTPLP